MSFVRLRKTNPSGCIPRKKKTIKKLPEWDDNLHDMNEFKATPEEIARRKEVHKSKHALAAKLQKQRQMKARKADLSISNTEARKLAIMKEVLYDQQEFQSVLAKSDKMMAVVKDLFGDAPNRMPGVPNVTSAPNGDGNHRNIVVPLHEIRTKSDTLSESMVDRSALNDLETDSDDEDDEDPSFYQPKFNLDRFQQFLANEEKNHTISTISGQAQMSHLDQGPIQSTQIQLDSMQNTRDFETPKKQVNGSILKAPNSAMNDTNKIKKSKKRVAPSPQQQHNTTSNMNLTDLRKVLEGLEDEIAEYERSTGRRAPAERHRQENFSGYTLSIVDSVTKLCRYLKENELRLKAETTVREQLTEDVTQLAQLIDALTSDIILTQEEYAKLNSNFTRYREETHSEILYLKTAVQNLSRPPSQTVPLMEDITPPRHKSPPQITDEVPWLEKEVNGIPDYLQADSAAVLLSPPVRKSRIQREQEMLEQMGRQSSLVDITTAVQNDLQPDSGLPTPNFNHPNVPSSHFQSSQQYPGSISSQSGYQQSGTGHVPVNIHTGYHQGGQVPATSLHQVSQVSVQNGMSIPQSRPQGHTQGPTRMAAPNRPYSVSTVHPAGANAHVRVPRPSLLVQSNVGVSLPGARQVVPSVQGQLPSQQSGQQQNNKTQLANQISELNKQHEEAQKRLQSLMQQQSNQMAGNTNDNYPIQHGLPAYPVSPPISPISQKSEGYLSLQGIVDQRLQNGEGPKRGITVSIPTVDFEASPQ
ncbi:spindle and centriole-associated protein 1-like [Mytilus edulis]|uniref:spindle and centriole-associated protein 1-like n=1 Tax=Mytilus edulis TaxID=6550 RepID=UPI0039F13B21